MSIHENKELLRRGLEIMWSKGQIEILDELISPSFVMHDVAGDFRGMDAYRQMFSLYRSAYPDLKFTIQDQIAEGDLLATRWSSVGTHGGELFGVPPTHKQTVGVGVTFSRIEAGKVVEEWNSWDALGQLQQLGMIPSEGRTEFTWTEPSTVTGSSGEPEYNRITALRYTEEVWNQRNVAALETFFHADIVSHEATTEHIVGQGLEGVRQATLAYLAAFPDLHVETEGIAVEGDRAALRWVCRGTHEGELLGIAPTGVEATWTGTTIYRFVGTRIVEQWWAWSALGLLQQLGVVETAE